MRKTKKLAALMLAGAMAASLAACGGQTASTDTTAAESADGEESTGRCRHQIRDRPAECSWRAVCMPDDRRETGQR